MRRPWGALCAAVVGVLALLACASANADVFESIQLTSVGRLPGSNLASQAGEARDPAISQDGRYVAFDGVFGGKRGVFRRDLATGEVGVVAEGAAELPSISAEGRYVSFTTNVRLDEENDTNEAPDVYVRDMEDPSTARCGPEWEQDGESCPYTLASAADGSSRGLPYAYDTEEYASSGSLTFLEAHYGSLASGRSALSANGQEVAFVTTAGTTLQAGGASVPRGQVMVRYLASRRTQLVSTVLGNGEETSEPVPSSRGGYFGAVFPGGEHAIPLFPFTSPYVGASLSADGNAVAWLGTQIALQAPVLADERLEASYAEPLWREVSEAGLGATRRVTGGSDPSNPLCAASGETALQVPESALDPCAGPFGTSETQGSAPPQDGTWMLGDEYDFVPQLSADGQTVAMLANARYLPGGEELTSAESSDDLYVVSMQQGLTRSQALTRLTALAGGGFNNPARTAPIVDLGVSPDGTQVAFSSARSVFPLGSPTLVSETAGALYNEIYDVDLANSTLTRVTRGFAGQTPTAPTGQDAAGSPSFSADGSLLSFSSTESNLVYGDGNDASDAFLVPRANLPTGAVVQTVSAAPPGVAPEPSWQLSATAVSERDGTVILYVLAPGAGSLRALAQAHLQMAARGRSHRHDTRTATVANSAGHVVAASGLVSIPLRLGKLYGRLAERREGLPATVALAFASPGHVPLRYGVRVVFRRTSARHGGSR